MGGAPAGPIDAARARSCAVGEAGRCDPAPAAGQRLLTLDELRRGVEELGPGAYDELSYFERWIASISNLLVEKGVLQVHELGDAIDAAQQRHAEAARP